MHRFAAVITIACLPAQSALAWRDSAYMISLPPGRASNVVPIPLSAAYRAQALPVARQQLESAGVGLGTVLSEAAAKAGETGS